MTDLESRLRAYIDPDDDSEDRAEIRALMLEAADEVAALGKSVETMIAARVKWARFHADRTVAHGPLVFERSSGGNVRICHARDVTDGMVIENADVVDLVSGVAALKKL